MKQKVELEILRKKVVNIWIIVYDGDSSQVYSFGDFNKAMASVEASIRGYIGDEDPGIELTFKKIMETVRKREHMSSIPIRIHELYIMLYRWELDDKHPIHQVLCECYDIVPPLLKSKIASLFFDSRC